MIQLKAIVEADLGYLDAPKIAILVRLLAGANLVNYIDLEEVDLTEADLRGVNLGGAKLAGANLRGAELMKANLSGADLSGADLQGANLSDADLFGADLLMAKYNQFTVWPKRFKPDDHALVFDSS